MSRKYIQGIEVRRGMRMFSYFVIFRVSNRLFHQEIEDECKIRNK